MVVTEDVKQTAPVIIAMVTDLGRALYTFGLVFNDLRQLDSTYVGHLQNRKGFPAPMAQLAPWCPTSGLPRKFMPVGTVRMHINRCEPPNDSIAVLPP